MLCTPVFLSWLAMMVGLSLPTVRTAALSCLFVRFHLGRFGCLASLSNPGRTSSSATWTFHVIVVNRLDFAQSDSEVGRVIKRAQAKYALFADVRSI